MGGQELHGHLSALEPADFVIHEVDLDQALTVRYSDVERVAKGYGRIGFSGRRVNQRHQFVLAATIVGGLIALAIASVAADKS